MADLLTLAQATKQELQKALGEHYAEVEKLNVELLKSSLDAYTQKVKMQAPIFVKRNAILKKIKGFWLKAMENDPRFAGLVDPVDRDCLGHLVDLEIKHDDTDGRNVTISLHFDQDNPYFSERTLTKKMTVTPAALADDVAKYDVDAPVGSTPVPITWSSPDHDLTKKKPRLDLDELEDGDDFEGSVGSFFNWFGETEDKVSASEMLIELHAGAVEAYAGVIEPDSDEEEDEESDDDPNAVVDLEDESEDEGKPSKKKQRT